MRMRNIGKGHRSIGSCPDCGTEFRLRTAGSWYAVSVLATVATLGIEVVLAKVLLPTGTPVFVVIALSMIVLMSLTILGSFPYTVRLERMADGVLTASKNGSEGKSNKAAAH